MQLFIIRKIEGHTSIREIKLPKNIFKQSRQMIKTVNSSIRQVVFQ